MNGPRIDPDSESADSLSAFIVANRDEIISRARQRVSERMAPRPTDEEIQRGIPLFIDQLVASLRARSKSLHIMASATRHGADLHRAEFTVAQVVHDYGDLCQAITQLAIERGASITATEFQMLNGCLDDAMAEAVSEHQRRRESSQEQAETQRLGFLAHELRNKIHAAMLAYGILKEGQVGLGGSTGAILDRNLKGLQDLITRSLAEVRVEAGVQHRESLSVRSIVEEVEAEAAMMARARGVHFTVSGVQDAWMVEADRALLVGALINLLGNAFKYTPPHGNAWLRTTVVDHHVLFEVEDECGGLPADNAEALFSMWTQRGSDKRGLGLGLPLVRRSIRALGGDVAIANKPGKGCIFSVRLLRPVPGGKAIVA